jgi:sugar transferase EpsL
MKRIFDILFSIIIIILSSPFMLFISVVIFSMQGKPILFRQFRLGKNHQNFRIVKFCTMTEKRNKNGELLNDKARITKVGSFLRKTSLDELPGFWNVLKGEMSVVGPRPLPPLYKDRYTSEQDRRHEIKPGVTGWAQVNGRNSITWDQKFLLDIWYLQNQSFILDLKIIFLTIYKVLLKKGITPKDNDFMEEFLGETNSKK